MDKKQTLKTEAKKDNEKFNSITNKVKVENQNQTHNVREEGIGRIGKTR
ncbi:MAG: hypothetical protein KIC94_17440 [Clostridiales bacterium]|nr:hypothetical protein [uncultured Anaerosporobacter sp.]MBS5934650.1 hypothetical protein [Clostridiales bacterium]